MKKQHIINIIPRVLLLTLVQVFGNLMLGSLACLAFDVGGRIDSRSDSRWYVEAVMQEYSRELETLLPRNNAKLRARRANPLENKVNISILAVRPTVFIGNRLSLFAELGLYNDLETMASSPFFAGVGGNFVLGRIGALKIVPFGAIRRTQSYLFQFERDILIAPGDPPILFSVNYNSRFSYYATGVMFAAELALAEDKEIFPYIGVEYSLHRSDLIDSIEFVSSVRGDDGTRLSFRIEDAVRVQAKEAVMFVFGATLVRKKTSSIRFESRFREENFSFSLSVGFFL